MNRRRSPSPRHLRPIWVVLLGLFVTAKAVPPNPNLWLGSESARAFYSQLPPDPIRRNARLQPDGIEYVLVLRVDFADKPGRRPRAQLDGWLFDKKGLSLASYYAEVSYGKMDVQPGPIGGSLPRDDGWYRMPKSMAFYGEGQTINLDRYQTLVTDALDIADADVDLRDYDRDGDGVLDHLIILHSGDDEASSGVAEDIWSVLVPDVRGRWDGIRVETAIVIAEEPSRDTPHLGVWFHEFLHDFGAPETYVNGRLVGANDQQFCLMGLFGPYQGNGDARDGTQPAHICSYLKWDLDGTPENGRVGWITPIELDTNTIGATIPAFSLPTANPPVYKIDVPGKDGKEFFLIENRNRNVGARFDTAIPDDGLLIWHVDETASRSAISVASRLWLEDPGDPEHRNLDFTITQDAAYAEEDGQTAFTPSTEPSSAANDGSPTGIALLNIGPSGRQMRFDLFFGDTFEPNDTIETAFPLRFDVPHSSFLYDAKDRADFYRIALKAGEALRIEIAFEAVIPVRIGLRDENGRLLTTATRLPDEENGRVRYVLLFAADRDRTLYLEVAAVDPVEAAHAYTFLATRESGTLEAPPRFTALRIYPNPVRPDGTVRFEIAFNQAGIDRITAEVFTPVGEKVGEVRADDLAVGNVTLEFRAENGGSPLAPGVYFVLFTARRNGQATQLLAKFAVE